MAAERSGSGARTRDAPVVADHTFRRVAPGVWLGGSPLRLFRLRPRGEALAVELARSRPPAAASAPPGPPPSPPAGVVAATRGERRLLTRLVAAGAAHPVPVPGAGPAPAEVAVVVPVRDDADGLDRLLRRLPVGLGEVLVVDDGSCPAHAERVRRCAAEHDARLLRRERPLGPGAARNTGAAATERSFVLFLDADVDPGGDWLGAVLAHFARPEVAAVAPRVRSDRGTGLLAAYESLRSPLDLGALPARVAPGTRVPYVPSAALVVSRRALEELGGFEADLRHGEDVDLVWRAVEAGHEVRYEPSAVVRHRPRPTWAAWIRQRVAYGTSAAELDRRHPGEVAPAAMSPWSLLLWVLVAAGHPVPAAALALANVAVLRRRLVDVPAPEVARLVLAGHLGAGRRLARAAVRDWWPVVVASSVVSRRGRRLGAACLVVHLATTSAPVWCRAVAVADDAAYGVGVWRGAWRRRDLRVLLPRLQGWP